jgi:glycosyltransferase involved in cell wall biosynthesis
LKKAEQVICTTTGMIGYSQRVYGIKKDHYFIKPACVDLELFSRRQAKPTLVPGIDNDSVVCVYVGKFGDIYLSHEVFDFFRVAAGYWGAKFKVLLLTNHSNEEIDSFCRKAKLPRDVVINRFVQHTEVPAYMALGDFGICPVRPIPTKKFCTPIKNGEYWAMGIPVVITKNISEDSRLIEENDIGYVLKELTDEEYLQAVEKIAALLLVPGLDKKIRKIAEIHRNYSIAESIYSSIYAS